MFAHVFQDDIMSFEAEKQAVYLQVYRPVYFQLVDVLLHKAQFPTDEEYASWSSDEKEQFRIYRSVRACVCDSYSHGPVVTFSSTLSNFHVGFAVFAQQTMFMFLLGICKIKYLNRHMYCNLIFNITLIFKFLICVWLKTFRFNCLRKK